MHENVSNFNKMERLVSELKNFNFQQEEQTEHLENRIPLSSNFKYFKNPQIETCLTKMSLVCDKKTEKNNGEQEISSDDASLVSTENEDSDSYNENEDVGKTDVSESEHKSRGGVNVRMLSQRATRQSSLNSRNLRTAMKAPKLKAKNLLRPADIKKLYTNRKLTNFRPTSLETIFEEPQPIKDSEQYRFVSVRKLRRTLKCTDGLNANKNLIKQRRAKIKKNLGRSFSWKKIPIKNFLEHMKQDSSSAIDEDINPIKNKKQRPINESIQGQATLNESNETEMDIEAVDANKTEKLSKKDNANVARLDNISAEV